MTNKRKPVIDEENNSPKKRSKITGKPGHSYDHFEKSKSQKHRTKILLLSKKWEKDVPIKSTQ